jgi:hypothetical protein
MYSYKTYPELVYNNSDKIQIIEIEIPKDGSLVSLEKESLINMKEIIGVAMINPAPKASGHGRLRLRIGDEEIFPPEFHADIISKFNSRYVGTRLNFGFKHYIFPLKVKAEGKPVKISYQGPPDGGSGKLYLYLFGTTCGHTPEIPKFRFQVIEMAVPKGNYSTDTEIKIDGRTLQSHEKIIGAVFVGQTNRIKSASLSIDGTTIFPEGMVSPLIFKELPTSHSIAGGIFTKHILPLQFMLHTCDIKARNSKVEGSIVAVPDPDGDYKIFLYLLALAQ